MRRVRSCLVVVAVLIAAACEPLPHEAGDAPFRGEVSRGVYDQNGDNQIIERGTIFGESNFYHLRDTETFLLNVAFVDCSERIEKVGWSSDCAHYALLIAGSTRFEFGTRLAVYGFLSSGVVELADIKDAEVVDFRFEEGALLYTVQSQGELSLTLP